MKRAGALLTIFMVLVCGLAAFPLLVAYSGEEEGATKQPEIQTDREKEDLIGSVREFHEYIDRGQDQKGVSVKQIEFEPSGCKSLERILEEGEFLGLANYKSNEIGFVTHADLISPTGEDLGRIEFVYDSKGRLTEQAQFGESSENAIKRFVFQYSEAGFLILETHYGDGEKSMVTKYQYNSAGLLENEIDYYPDGKEWYRRTYKYDKDGRVAEECHSREEEIGGTFVNKYDQQGWLEEQSACNEQGEVVLRTVYKRDQQGNWIQRQILRKNGAAWLELEKRIREIEYFEDKSPQAETKED